MVSLRNLLVSALAMGSAVALGATLPDQAGSVAKRGRADVVQQILKAIGVLTKENVHTWASSTSL